MRTTPILGALRVRPDLRGSRLLVSSDLEIPGAHFVDAITTDENGRHLRHSIWVDAQNQIAVADNSPAHRLLRQQYREAIRTIKSLAEAEAGELVAVNADGFFGGHFFTIESSGMPASYYLGSDGALSQAIWEADALPDNSKMQVIDRSKGNDTVGL